MPSNESILLNCNNEVFWSRAIGFVDNLYHKSNPHFIKLLKTIKQLNISYLISDDDIRQECYLTAYNLIINSKIYIKEEDLSGCNTFMNDFIKNIKRYINDQRNKKASYMYDDENKHNSVIDEVIEKILTYDPNETETSSSIYDDIDIPERENIVEYIISLMSNKEKKAWEIYLKANGNITKTEISNQLGLTTRQAASMLILRGIKRAQKTLSHILNQEMLP